MQCGLNKIKYLAYYWNTIVTAQEDLSYRNNGNERIAVDYKTHLFPVEQIREEEMDDLTFIAVLEELKLQ